MWEYKYVREEERPVHRFRGAAPAQVLAVFSECTFHSRGNETRRSRELGSGFTRSFVACQWPGTTALQSHLGAVFTSKSEGTCEAPASVQLFFKKKKSATSDRFSSKTIVC